MTITLSNENKSSELADNFEAKESSSTWADHTETWGEASGTWAAPGRVLSKESKNSEITPTNESKT